MRKSHSQAGQDIFVMSLFDENYKGIFVDVGCYTPFDINNTLLLEENGWSGIALDLVDYSKEWEARTAKFICGDAITCDYKQLFLDHNMPLVIDYLSLDIEGDGSRYLALKKVMESGYEFKVITVEHDAYRGYDQSERVRQRKLLKELGYHLLCADVINGQPFEDWWINPKYFNEIEYSFYECSFTDYFNILNMKGN